MISWRRFLVSLAVVPLLAAARAHGPASPILHAAVGGRIAHRAGGF